MLAFALSRIDIGNYVSALFWVYAAIIIIYILLNMMFSLGLRPPYSRALNSVLSFLRDVSEPYLRIFRRIIPPLGVIDFSPWVALIVLYALRAVIVGAIQGTL
jgi:YggT family protein